MRAYISDERDGEYILDLYEGDELYSWHSRVTVVGENVPSDFGVGDVVKGRYNIPESAEFSLNNWVTSMIDEGVREDYELLAEHLTRAVDDYDIDLGHPRESVEDGDILLVVDQPGSSDVRVDNSETLYTTFRGITYDGRRVDSGWPPTPFKYLLNCPKSILESALAFDRIDLGGLLYGLRFNREKTEACREEPIVGTFHGVSDISDFSSAVESKDGIEGSLYAFFDGDDDGGYYTSIYDEGEPDPDGDFENYRLVHQTVFATPDYLVPISWPYMAGGSTLVPVDELVLGEHDYHDWEYPVVLISHDAEPIEPDELE